MNPGSESERGDKESLNLKRKQAKESKPSKMIKSDPNTKNPIEEVENLDSLRNKIANIKQREDALIKNKKNNDFRCNTQMTEHYKKNNL